MYLCLFSVTEQLALCHWQFFGPPHDIASCAWGVCPSGKVDHVTFFLKACCWWLSGHRVCSQGTAAPASCVCRWLPLWWDVPVLLDRVTLRLSSPSPKHKLVQWQEGSVFGLLACGASSPVTEGAWQAAGFFWHAVVQVCKEHFMVRTGCSPREQLRVRRRCRTDGDKTVRFSCQRKSANGAMEELPSGNGELQHWICLSGQRCVKEELTNFGFAHVARTLPASQSWAGTRPSSCQSKGSKRWQGACHH